MVYLPSARVLWLRNEMSLVKARAMNKKDNTVWFTIAARDNLASGNTDASGSGISGEE